MLSRRNVRVKVMQVLYALNRDADLDLASGLKAYRKIVQQSYELYLFGLYALQRVAAYAEQDAATRAAKMLPTDKDKAFEPILATNAATQSLMNHKSWQALIEDRDFSKWLEDDTVRLLYTEFFKTEAHQNYLNAASYTDEEHVDQLLKLFKFLAAEETYNDLLEDNYHNWTDDRSLVVGAIKRTIKTLPTTEDFYRGFIPGEETIKEFGESLLSQVLQKNQGLLEIIEPSLRNWDSERVAVIDMVILKMAIAEFLFFSSIPTKVTLNEYVELAKTYSTDKSKDFVNGILDRILKELEKEDRINKEGRGLK